MAKNIDDMAVALLGIATTKQPLDNPCPPDNTVSAFIEQRLDKKTRAMMIAHLNQCESCYCAWENLTLFLAEEQLPELQSQTANKPGFLENIKNRLNSATFWKSATPGLAFASLFLAVVIVVPDLADNKNPPESLIIAPVLDNTVALADNLKQLHFPWQDQTYAFSSSGTSVATQAFGVGLWNARNNLLNTRDPLPAQLTPKTEINWEASQYRYYYNFGQWTLNAWALAKTARVSPAQWLQQRQILKKITVGLAQQQGAEAITAIKIADKIITHLEILSKKPNIVTQEALLRDIEMGMQRIFL